METLLTKLKYDDIPILKMVEEVQKVCDFCKRVVYRISNVLSRDIALPKNK
jgi:hypothetical protein